jgi:outer membrane receptor for ferrienterochelin and colicin
MNLKFGVKNLLDDNIVYQQTQNYKEGGAAKTKTQITNKFKPGRQFKVGVTMNF